MRNAANESDVLIVDAVPCIDLETRLIGNIGGVCETIEFVLLL